MSQIWVTYKTAFTSGSDLSTQLSDMGFNPLNEGELDMTAMTIASDVTSFQLGMIQRLVKFNETPETLARIGLPLTDAKRISFVTGVFSYKITQRLRKPVSEEIVLM